MLSLSTPIYDLILGKQSLQSSHALGRLSCCKLSHSAPFHISVLTLPQCHSYCLDFIFIVLWQLHCAHLSKTTDPSEGHWPIWVLGDLSLKLSLGFMGFCSLKSSWRYSAKGQQSSHSCYWEFSRLPFIPLPGPTTVKVRSETTLKTKSQSAAEGRLHHETNLVWKDQFSQHGKISG